MKTAVPTVLTALCSSLLSAVLFASPVPAEQPVSCRAGVARVDITPGANVPMAGYYHERLATGVHDPLHAKAIVIESGGTRAALVALDLIGTNRAFVEEARRLVEAETGIPGAHVMISATHAHTGPILVKPTAREDALGGKSAVAVEYARALPRLIADAVKRAASRLTDARVKIASGHEDTLAFNRRFHMKDGSFGWNAGKLNPRILRAAGPIDPDVPVVSFESTGGRPLAVYVNYAMHLDTTGGTQISADYPSTLASSLARIKGDEFVTVFTIGCAGDINHIDVAWGESQKGHAEAARIGTVLAGAVVETFPRLRDVEAGAVRCRSELVELALAKISDADVAAAHRTLEKGKDDRAVPFLELVKAYQVIDVHTRQGEPLRGEVQVIALGRELVWVGLPGEIFVELGIAIKQASPFELTVVAELANGGLGYIPTRQAYTQGQYEVISARVAAGSGEKLVETASRLLREVFAEASQ